MKRELVIFVPGAKYIQASNNWFERMVGAFYTAINFLVPPKKNYSISWAKALKKKNRDVIWLHWGGGITLVAKWRAVRKLKKLIEHYKNTHNIYLVGLSLGGEIVRATIPFTDGEVKLVILLCSTNERTKINTKTRIFNVYSPNDKFAKFSAKELAPFRGGILLEGKNVKNMSIPNLRHEDFFLNRKIKSGKYRGKRMSDVVNNLL